MPLILVLAGTHPLEIRNCHIKYPDENVSDNSVFKKNQNYKRY